MASIFINGSAGANSFELILPDGTKNFAPNYEAFSFGDQVQINHKYETVANIAGPALYSEYSLNGASFDSAKELVSALNAIINFKSGGGSGGGIPDAPIDGKQYGRQDGSWTEVIGGSGAVNDVQVDGDSVVFDGTAYIDLAGKLDKVRSSTFKQAVYGFDMNGSEQTVFPTDDPDKMPQPDAIVKRTSDGGIRLADGSTVLSSNEIMELIYNNIPEPTPPVRFNVTEMFTFNPAVPDAKVWMRDDGQQKPEIEIIANNSGNDTNDLVITAASGFGSWYDMTGNKALQAFGRDITTGASGIYDVTITGETEIAQTVITVPKEVDNFHGIYFLGSTIAPKASYWVDYNGVSHSFELENTPLSNFGYTGDGLYLINGVKYNPSQIKHIVFGDSYKNEQIIPERFFLNSSISSDVSIDIGLMINITTYEDYALADLGERYEDNILQIRNYDSTNLINIGTKCFDRASLGLSIYADTQAGGEAFRAKFPNLSSATIVVNS